MTFYPRLFLRCQFEIVEVGGEVTAVSVGDNGFNGVVLLKNESTRFMFEKLEEGITLPELIKACLDRYTDSTIDEVGPQVIAFLDKIRGQGLLVADRMHGIKVGDMPPRKPGNEDKPEPENKPDENKPDENKPE